MTESPLRATRTRLGLSASELATASGATIAEVSRSERHGAPIAGRVIVFLTECGIDGEELRRRQEAFRQAQQAAIRTRAVTRLREEVAR